MSQTSNDTKPRPVIDKSEIEQSIKDKGAIVKTNQIVKK